MILEEIRHRSIVGITAEELEEKLASRFRNAVSWDVYGYLDYGLANDPNWKNTFDKLLRLFEDEKRRIIENQIDRTMSELGVHRIMDQGCGYANSLRDLTQRFSAAYPQSEFEGYGVSASRKDMQLEQIELQRKKRQMPSFFGIEEDIHTVMKTFPHQLDLVISDHMYLHLVAPWLALKRTADKLIAGGVALLRTVPLDVKYLSQQPMDSAELVELLKQDNPDYTILISDDMFVAKRELGWRVLAIIKQAEVPFVTNQYLAFVQEGYNRDVCSFYARQPVRNDLLSIDNL